MTTMQWSEGFGLIAAPSSEAGRDSPVIRLPPATGSFQGGCVREGRDIDGRGGMGIQRLGAMLTTIVAVGAFSVACSSDSSTVAGSGTDTSVPCTSPDAATGTPVGATEK